MASRKKGISSTVAKTKGGRVSKSPVNQTAQNCVMGWAAIENCRQKKKKQISNKVNYAKKKGEAKDIYHANKKVDKKKLCCIVLKFAHK